MRRVLLAVLTAVLTTAATIVPVGSAQAAATRSSLSAGQQLASGQSRSLRNADVQLVMTIGGDLALVVAGAVTWSSGTADHTGAYLSMQTDGNLVLRAADGRALWATYTQGHAGASAVLTASGTFGVVDRTTAGLWWSGVAGDALQSGQTLASGAALTAPAGQVSVSMQTDGNLVVRRAGAAVWATYTQGHPGAVVTMQTDGNLVLRAASGRVLWADWSTGNVGAALNVLDIGLLVVYSSIQRPLWWQDPALGRRLCALTSPSATGTSVTRWDPVVLCVFTMLNQPSSELSDVRSLITYESSGDPNAVNLWDSNAVAGHPSKGLIQVIQPTFDAWRSDLLPNDLYNPAANLYAGLNYAIHRYGSIHAIPGLVSLRNGGGYKGYSVTG